MPEPTVVAILLTADRQALTERAVRCFLRQTYENKRLLIYDTGKKPFEWSIRIWISSSRIEHCVLSGAKDSIGALRNNANSLATHGNILIHWDSDDWSHPRRIEYQVGYLTSDALPPLGTSWRPATGYREMLMWRSTDQTAWIYRHVLDWYALGTSLCYWRKTWEQHPFDERNVAGADDREWARIVKPASFSAMDGPSNAALDRIEPLMIAEIHGANTCARIDEKATEWRRVQEWDAYCHETLEEA
jgi:Glycosyl transferase family 2